LQTCLATYPIRVLTAALAFRLSKVEGKLPRYEEGDNAKRIQQIGIPGLNNQGFGGDQVSAPWLTLNDVNNL